MAAIVLAAPIVVAAVVIAAPEIATVVARSAAAKATKEFAKSVTKDAVKKTLAVGMNATLEVQGSLVNAERLTGTAAAVVEENSMGSALSKEFETMMNVVLKTMK